MSTKVEVKNEVETEVESVGADAEAKTLMADTTVVTDKTFIKLMAAVDTHQKAVGGKWYALIQHLIKTHLLHLQVDFKTLSAEQKEELKLGKKVILKSLLEMQKTPGSAQVIRSNIIRLAKPENREALEKMGKGEITVRAAREAGRKAQTAGASRSDEERYRSAIDTVARYADGLGYDSAKVYADIGEKLAEYAKKNGVKTEPTDEEKAAQKADFKVALEQTVKEQEAKKLAAKS